MRRYASLALEPGSICVAEQLEITQLGHPLLRQKASEVTTILATQTQHLIDQMFATVNQAKGMGIAAPQVAYSQRIFIMCCQPNQRYPNAPQMDPTAVINPVITQYGEEIEKDWEGCLSLPGLRGNVPRHKHIQVAYSLRDGQRVEASFDGFLARLFQHELDHLDGIVFIDRVATTEIYMEKEWRKQILSNDLAP